MSTNQRYHTILLQIMSTNRSKTSNAFILTFLFTSYNLVVYLLVVNLNIMLCIYLFYKIRFVQVTLFKPITGNLKLLTVL